MKSIFIYCVISGFVLGVVWQDFFELNWNFVLFLSVLYVFVLSAALHYTKGVHEGQIGKTHPQYKMHAVMLSRALILFLLAFMSGVLRMQIDQNTVNTALNIYDKYEGKHMLITGVVIDEPDRRDNFTYLTVEPIDLKCAEECEQSGVSVIGYDVKIIAQTQSYTEFAYGDKVIMKGVLEKPENFQVDNGRIFDYVNYLEKDGIYYSVKFPEMDLLSRGHGNYVKSALFDIKQKYIDSLNELIPEPESGLAAGITVGAKRALGKELTEAFRNTGLIHIVVLSGFNVTVIIIFLLHILRAFPRWIKWGFISVAVILFAILTGADAPVVRASIMGLLGVAALVLSRTYAVVRALFIAVFVMVIWNPNIALNDVSFQLSVTATLGLVMFSRQIIDYLNNIWPGNRSVAHGVSIRHSLLEIAGITMAAQIAVLPLLIYYMGEVSVVAVIVNMLTLPIIPISMLFAFIAGVAGMFSSSIAAPFAFTTYILLAYIIGVVEFFNSLPITTLQIF